MQIASILHNVLFSLWSYLKNSVFSSTPANLNELKDELTQAVDVFKADSDILIKYNP